MTAADIIPALAILAVLTRELMWLSALGIAVSGIDDLLVDLIWLFGIAHRGETLQPLQPVEAGQFAILVPAWDESAVIGAMLRHVLQTQQHAHFTVFVGVYTNDPATVAVVQAIEDPRLVVVSTGHDGPTTKADCLNALWRGALAHELVLGRRFKGIVLHDAEDVVHPASLALYDRWMPDYAMVQLPVIPFADQRSLWVSGHYLDEFAENHGKDMLVRGLLGAPVPSAGVGTAIDRTVLEGIAGGGAPFDASSLTEDYELGHKIHALGLKGRLVRHRVDGEIVATREYFPATVESAVHQKSRWQTGIALAGWDRIGWHGTLARRWMLFRDRKGPVCAAIAIVAYASLMLVITQVALRRMMELPDGAVLPLFFGPEDSVFRWLIVVNAGLLAWRLMMRGYFTGRTHGLAEGLRSVPRAVVANVINFLAAVRAVERYRRLLEGGGQFWGKTAHRFPAIQSGAAWPVGDGGHV